MPAVAIRWSAIEIEQRLRVARFYGKDRQVGADILASWTTRITFFAKQKKISLRTVFRERLQRMFHPIHSQFFTQVLLHQ